MTPRVVDLLEIVDVNHHDVDERVVAAGIDKFTGGTFCKCLAV